MKVYLATRGEYSDYRVCHVFARREDAAAYKLGDDVEEFDVHDGPVEVRHWHTLHWFPWLPERLASPDHAANPLETRELRDFDGRPGLWHDWNSTLTPGRQMLTVGGWDLERVRKVYSEQRAQYLARQEGVS